MEDETFEHAKLNEFDKDEWRDIYFHFKPNATEADYDKAWAEFVEEKRKRSMH